VVVVGTADLPNLPGRFLLGLEFGVGGKPGGTQGIEPDRNDTLETGLGLEQPWEQEEVHSAEWVDSGTVGRMGSGTPELRMGGGLRGA
jgi:hypothetical protein